MRRANIEDAAIVKSIYADEKIWPYVTDDGIKDIEQIDFAGALNNTGVYFILAEDDGIPVGVFMFNPWNTVTYEMHSAILPGNRGGGSVVSSRLAGMWMFNNTLCRKIVTHIPQPNYAARALAKIGGMVLIGINRKSFLKNGNLIDQYIFGICKEDV